ncbi:MAG: bifunctional oligoribonuclease/PAP phosphatase NrnA [Eubacterium sp.]|nr:bifunctional oligoribonuclease/PAP phosphatase NrnA [Eubacterium sp.]
MKKIDEIIGDAKTVGIAGHIRPDGDCIGSCMSLYNYLKKNKSEIEVRVFLEFVDEKFRIIKNTDRIETEGFDGTVFDLFISLDTASFDRLGKNAPFFENAKRTVCIDHHKSNQGYADYNYIVPEASSASEVLYGLLDVELFDKSIAEPMYMGIAHDSGVFRFQSTTSTTMNIAAKMIDFGIDVNTILEDTFYRKSYNQLMITAKIQSNVVLCMDGKCIYGYCTSDMMKEYGVSTNDLDAVIASIRNVAGVEVAMFVYQLEENKFKISLRSKKYVDVSEIAVSFGGGGHARAAGFDMEGSLEEVIKCVTDRISQKI